MRLLEDVRFDCFSIYVLVWERKHTHTMLYIHTYINIYIYIYMYTCLYTYVCISTTLSTSECITDILVIMEQYNTNEQMIKEPLKA